MNECIAKQKLNIILLVDASKSMGGNRISQVNQAVNDIKDYLIELQKESSNVDFYITLIPFNNGAFFYNNQDAVIIDNFKFDGIKVGGWSNLHCAYQKLGEILNKESKGGIMPDFGGLAPIILLLTDGHPTGKTYKEELKKIENSPWFKVALRYGIAIEKDDKITNEVLRSFVGNNGDVIQCLDATKLKNIIKIIVITASKVKSSSANINYQINQSNSEVLKQEIANALQDVDELDW